MWVRSSSSDWVFSCQEKPRKRSEKDNEIFVISKILKDRDEELTTLQLAGKEKDEKIQELHHNFKTYKDKMISKFKDIKEKLKIDNEAKPSKP